MKLHYGDLTDSTCLVKIINQVKPTEIYNLGAQSHVKVSQYVMRSGKMSLRKEQKATIVCKIVGTIGTLKGYDYGTFTYFKEQTIKQNREKMRSKYCLEKKLLKKQSVAQFHIKISKLPSRI